MSWREILSFLACLSVVTCDTVRIGPYPTSLGPVDYQAIFGANSPFKTGSRALTTDKQLVYAVPDAVAVPPDAAAAAPTTAVTPVGEAQSAAAALSTALNSGGYASTYGGGVPTPTPDAVVGWQTMNWTPTPVLPDSGAGSTDSSSIIPSPAPSVFDASPDPSAAHIEPVRALPQKPTTAASTTTALPISPPQQRFPQTLEIAKIQQGPSVVGSFTKQAVTSDSSICTEIGNRILSKGGNAVDAAISVLFCTGVVHPHDCGLGGSVLLNVYMRDRNQAITVSGLSSSPQKSSDASFQTRQTSGWSSVATPGFLSGVHEAHRQFGSLDWASLIEPAFILARDGFAVDADLAANLQSQRDRILADLGLRATFTKGSDQLFTEGQIIKLPKLAGVLETIAKDPCHTCEFYKLGIGKALLADITNGGGSISRRDLASYHAVTESSSRSNLTGGWSLLTTPLPSAGPILNYIMQTLEASPSATEFDINMALHYHRRLEATAFGYARLLEMGDPLVNPDMQEYLRHLSSGWFAERTRNRIMNDTCYTDRRAFGMLADNGFAPSNTELKSGSSAAVVDSTGNAVAAYATLGSPFGSGKMSLATGIIMNNEMADFDYDTPQSPANPANKVGPKKRPRQWTAPTIALDADGDAQLVAAAAGGKSSLSALIQVIYNMYHAGYELKMAVDQRSAHCQMNPLRVEYEPGFPTELAATLSNRNHQLAAVSSAFSLQAIQVNKDTGTISALNGSRRPAAGSSVGI